VCGHLEVRKGKVNERRLRKSCSRRGRKPGENSGYQRSLKQKASRKKSPLSKYY
jgi:hypothetical protein